MELLEIDLGGGSSWGPAAGAASPGPQPPDARGRGCSSADSLAEEEEEEEEAPAGRSSRTSSLVSGLLTELYSCGGRARHQDSVDSSTEASAGSDVFPGGRGSSSAESRFLQELQQRPSQRHQIEYLGQKDADELTAIVQELNYRICVQSAKLLRHLKQKDRLLHKVQKNCDIVTACLQAVSQKRQKIFKASILQMLKHKHNFNHVSQDWALNSDGEILATVKSMAKLLLTLLDPGFHLACKSCKSEF